MKKKKYAVIGHPIGHTMSPFIHNRLFELSGIDADYEVLDIAPEDLANAYENQLKNLNGYNVTIPHKQAIIPFMDKLDIKANMYGSVNTVCNNGSSSAFTTDPDGFLAALKTAGISLLGKVVILGTGGVARTFAFEAVKAGADVTIAVRREDIHIVSALVGEIKTKIPRASCSSCFIERINQNIDLLINATPVGMFPNTNQMPISEGLLNSCQAVFDAVYNPLETKLLSCAKAKGIKSLGGMPMLVWQAVESHKIWNNSVYNVKDIEQLCIDSEIEMEKIFKK